MKGLQIIAKPSNEMAQPSGLVSTVIGAVTTHIRSHEMMTGDRLPSEATLARDLNVSRTVVREALRSLAAMRIVELQAGKRATVAQLDHGPLSLLFEHGVSTEQITIQQIYDLRRTIEARIVALAALRRTEAQAAQIIGFAEAMSAARKDPAQVMENDLAFHHALAEACRNPVYILLIGAFQGIIRQNWSIGWRARTEEGARDAMLGNHLAMARAIDAGDPVEASRLMGLHFDDSLRILLDAGIT